MKPWLGLLCTLSCTGVFAGEGAIRALRSDGRQCWAAGDAGLILCSRDAGQTWRRADSGVAANFHFIAVDGKRVYFFGGENLPGHPEGAGAGTILQTYDGGASFKAIPAPSVGWLYGGAAVSEGIVTFGQAGPAVPGGIWRTVTLGEIWQPLSLSSRGYLVGGAFQTARYGYVVGQRHRIISLRGLSEPAVHPPETPSRLTLRAARFAGEELCWCAGENGTVLTSRPGGRAWHPVMTPLPTGTRRLADFETLAAAPPRRVWLAGGQIGSVPYSENQGATWKLLAAPAPGAIHALETLGDAGALLAAGDAGRIWHSSDAGATWRLVHGSERTDVLFVLSAADKSLFPAIVAHAAAGLDVAVVFATHAGDDAGAPADQPVRAAAVQAGATGVTVLSDFCSVAGVSDAENLAESDVLARWSADLDTPAGPEMIRQLTAAIRLYRPAVLAVGPDGQGPRGLRAECRLVARLAQQASTLAADKEACGELAAVGLKPWSVSRIFVGLEENEQSALPWEQAAPPSRKEASVLIDTAAFPQGYGTTIEMLTQQALWRMPWLDLLDRPGRFNAYKCKGEVKPGLLFTAGLSAAKLQLRPVDETWRDLALATQARFAAGGDRIATALDPLAAAARKANDPAAAVLAADRALLVWGRLLQQGRLVQAEQALDLFLDLAPQHPLHQRMAAIALARDFSAEWGAQRAQQAPPVGRQSRLQEAIKRFAASQAWSTMASGRMLHAKALASSGREPAANDVYNLLAAEPYPADWRQCARAEAGLPVPLDTHQEKRRGIAAQNVSEPGNLDGRLDEPFWQRVPKVPLHSGPGRETGAAEAARSPTQASPPRKGAGENPPAAPKGAVEDASQEAAARPAGSFQVIRTAAAYVVFAVRLKAAEGRVWQLDLAIDSDRDAWTQLLLRCDTLGRRSAHLLMRYGPPADLDRRTFSVQARQDDEECTFELALPLYQVGHDPARGGVWNFQVRATANDRGKVAALWFQPQEDSRLLPHRYGLLEIPLPAPARPSR